MTNVLTHSTSRLIEIFALAAPLAAFVGGGQWH